MLQRLADEACCLPLPDGRSAVYNRFFPSLVVLNARTAALLQRMRTSRGAASTSALAREVLPGLRRNRLLAAPARTPYRAQFVRSMEQELGALRQAADQARAAQQGYGNLHLANHACNLRCPYCVNAFRDGAHPGRRQRRRPRADIQAWLHRALDQLFERPPAGAGYKIVFGGGEFLLHWDLLVDVVAYVQQQHPSARPAYEMNTNGTLLTEERARFLARHGFQLSIALDGQREAHDLSRRYADGRGTFDDVLRAWRLMQRHGLVGDRDGFQGTIHDRERFDADAFFDLARHGFATARLAPNLMGIDEEEGARRAHLHADLLERSAGEALRYTDLAFENINKLLQREDLGFAFFCEGLASFKGVTLYVDTLEVKMMCEYVAGPTVTLDRLPGGIYDPRLWQNASTYVQDRVAAIQRHCLDCEVVGVCRGGCVMSGLDPHNRRNPAACAFQRVLWQRLVRLVAAPRAG